MTISQVLTYHTSYRKIVYGNTIGSGQATYQNVVGGPPTEASPTHYRFSSFIIVHIFENIKIQCPVGNFTGKLMDILRFLPREAA